MASIKKNLKWSLDLLIADFKNNGIDLDFSVESVEFIEKIMASQLVDGEPTSDGFFAENMEKKLGGIASYIGEVIIRNTKASKWEIDENDPEGGFNISVVSANSTKMFPVQKVLARIHNDEDNIYLYTSLAVKKYMKFDGEIPDGFFNEESKSKPWWRFW
jgi:hypothetical protein